MQNSAPRHRVLENRVIGRGTHVLRLERKNMDFQSGQHLSVSPPESRDFREYSIFSGIDDDYLEILVKSVDRGVVSNKLCGLGPSDTVGIWGPLGFFQIPPSAQGNPLVFVATGTGVSPYRSFVRSRNNLDYTLIHGIRHQEDFSDYSDFHPQRVVTCVSTGEGGNFRGRVTAYLESRLPPPQAMVYLCGNCDMIYQVFDLLKAGGHPAERIFTEVYF